MNQKEKLIIGKLLKIAENQQKIITKLAQAVDPTIQANIEYLKNAWMTAGLNAGVPQMTSPKVEYTPGSTSPSASGAPVIETESYTLYAEGVPQNKAQELLNTFRTQVKTQKPELNEKKLNVIFGPKPSV